ncbi:pre-rRNA-processing protein TSR2 homolog [Chenopodium quinoa]|uniref:pre-rRNA-processing protein TSR2 homolog n=1 Tax=Chenopodium quinoa TaxID=63459 RepID=UPI000B7728DA|nr:pre-rRNA-processing protein TSR2 homolog [Chenopodium quinoa]
METSKRSKLTADALKQFQQGVSLVFSGWVALQDAVNGGWGGLYSREKAVSIEYSVLSFFCQPKNNEPLCIFDLEDLLCDGMNSMSLMDYEGECEEVANKLMVMYEECLEGDYQSIQRLRDARPIRHVVPVINNDDDDNDDDDDVNNNDTVNDDGPSMMIDSQASSSNNEVASQDMEMDGWIPVTRKKSKGQRK